MVYNYTMDAMKNISSRSVSFHTTIKGVAQSCGMSYNWARAALKSGATIVEGNGFTIFQGELTKSYRKGNPNAFKNMGY